VIFSLFFSRAFGSMRADCMLVGRSDRDTLVDGDDMIKMARRLGVVSLSDEQLRYSAGGAPEGWI